MPLVERISVKVLYVELLDEVVEVWRLVMAERRDGDRFMKVDQSIPELEVWELLPGDLVEASLAVRG